MTPSAPFVLGPADARILAAHARYFYLTAGQLTSLLYAATSQTYAQARLKRLADAGYLQRIILPRPTRTGSAPLVSTLARKGLQVLAAWGRPVDRRYRPAEVREATYLHLKHTLALNDVLIALELFCRREPRVQITALRHERELKLHPLRVRLPDGSRSAVIPDAWVDLRVAERFQECYAVELDRGTVERHVWRRKVAGLVAYVSGPYQQAFRTSSLTVAVVATPGDARCERLVRWTEAELAALRQKRLARLFRFTGAPVLSLGPSAFFTGTVWRSPFDRQPEPLLDLSDIPHMTEISAIPESAETWVLWERDRKGKTPRRKGSDR